MATSPSRNRFRKVALLTNYPVDHKTFTGGVETATAALLEGLRAHQGEFEFHVVSVSGLISSDLREERHGFQFHFLSRPRSPLARPRFPLRVVKGLRELQRIRPDLVHCQDNMALAVAAVLAGYPRLFTVHGVKRDESRKRTGWEFWSASFDALLERHVHRRFDAFVTISDYSARVVGERGRTFSIPNPVSSLFFQRARREDLDRISYLLFVGVLAPLKRPLDLLMAHAELRERFPRLETILCGDVEDKGYAAAMREVIVRRGIDGVHFLGRVSQEKLAELLAGAIALILPSGQENSPMVIAEAMATGTPVVATRVGGVPGLVEHEKTGLLYEAGDIHALTQAIDRLLVDPMLRQRMGDRAKRVAVAAYSPERVAAATVAAYRQLLDGYPVVASEPIDG